jgi:hypothetical protein
MIQRTVGPEIKIEAVLAAGAWPTLCDANQLENAILNLCINARDAMPDGGRLMIETANTWLDERAARERDMAPGQYLAVSVTDTGTGMPAEIVTRAFDPFFTTSASPAVHPASTVRHCRRPAWGRVPRLCSATRGGLGQWQGRAPVWQAMYRVLPLLHLLVLSPAYRA